MGNPAVRIISSFHDYYDCIMGQIRDPTVCFVRETREVPLKDTLVEKLVVGRLTSFDLRTKDSRRMAFGCFQQAQPGLLFFCGKVVPYLRYDYPSQVYPPVSHVSFDAADVFQRHPGLLDGTKQTIEHWFKEHEIVLWWWSTSGKRSRYAMKEKHRKVINLSSPAFVKFALQNQVAYYLIECRNRHLHLQLYPSLKELQLHKDMPPLTAFTAIMAYLTNDLAREREMPIKPVPDSVKAESHGFDKWSFRKEPSSPRRKRT